MNNYFPLSVILIKVIRRLHFRGIKNSADGHFTTDIFSQTRPIVRSTDVLFLSDKVGTRYYKIRRVKVKPLVNDLWKKVYLQMYYLPR
jgi:hypothetical protein